MVEQQEKALLNGEDLASNAHDTIKTTILQILKYV